MVSDIDGMRLLYVPAGEFIMGSDTGPSNQAPAHTVILDAFWIDQTEVTIAMYKKCVQAGACQPPIEKPDNYYYYGDAQYDDYPVIYVDWSRADAYCTWAGRRLPTEAEWEKAASWDDQAKTKRTYPWGDEEPTVLLLNYNKSQKSAMPVGTYPDGTSLYGALDMAGNVWEWVTDYYDPNYYKDSPSSNPPGPTVSQGYRVIRGGSFFTMGAAGVTASFRFPEEPDEVYSGVGLRCAQTP